MQYLCNVGQSHEKVSLKYIELYRSCDYITEPCTVDYLDDKLNVCNMCVRCILVTDRKIIPSTSRKVILLSMWPLGMAILAA